jgi:hypothetical protein
MAQVQMNSNNVRQYAIQARIEFNGQLLYINDQYTPVQLIPASINLVNVFMKKIGVSTNPGLSIFNWLSFVVFISLRIGGIFTTRPPTTNNIYMCQQVPDVGPCRAFVEQYYFNTVLRSCQIFIWGGCGGNQNRFLSRDECERTCSIYRRKITTNNAKQKWLNWDIDFSRYLAFSLIFLWSINDQIMVSRNKKLWI